MGLPTISVINFSDVTDQQVQDAIRAVNCQIQQDFQPIWGHGRELIMHAASFVPTDPATITEEFVRGDSVLYLVKEATLPGALGYHDMNTREVPVGFVFTETGEWTTTLSHEALELINDPTVNIFVPGPDPRDTTKWLLHSYEACDAVESTSYQIDGISVSNFVTPEYFRPENAPGTRNDFLGVGVASFGVMPGSHLGVVDPSTYDFEFIYGELRAHAASREVTNAQTKRCKMYDHPKRRPDDERMLVALKTYQRKPVRLGKGLTMLGGITRASRYRDAAQRMQGGPQR